MVLVGAGNAAAQTGGWLLVRKAIDKGITAHNEHHLLIVGAIYLGVAAAGWVTAVVAVRRAVHLVLGPESGRRGGRRRDRFTE